MPKKKTLTLRWKCHYCRRLNKLKDINGTCNAPGYYTLNPQCNHCGSDNQITLSFQVLPNRKR